MYSDNEMVRRRDEMIDEFVVYMFRRGTPWRIWVRHCATSRKSAGSITGDFIGIFR